MGRSSVPEKTTLLSGAAGSLRASLGEGGARPPQDKRERAATQAGRRRRCSGGAEQPWAQVTPAQVAAGPSRSRSRPSSRAAPGPERRPRPAPAGATSAQAASQGASRGRQGPGEPGGGRKGRRSVLGEGSTRGSSARLHRRRSGDPDSRERRFPPPRPGEGGAGGPR